jgi:hypothetical protein
MMRLFWGATTIMFRKITIISLGIAVLAVAAACDQQQKAAEPTPMFRTGEAFEDGTTARPWTHLDFANNPDNFQFAVITDRTGGARPGVFPAIMKKANLMQPEFIMSVGDYIEGYTQDKNQLRAEWAEIDGFVSVLDAPLFFTVGNHDVINQATEDIWRERAAKTRYHFVYKNVLFLVLNSEDTRYATPEEQVLSDKAGVIFKERGWDAAVKFAEGEPVLANFFRDADLGRIGEEQSAWLTQVLLDNADVRWTFVFMHRPLWRTPNPGFKQLEDALAGRGYTMMAGHIHNYTYDQNQGADYISMGTNGGGWGDMTGPGNMDHITWITMRNDGPVFANLVATGILAKDEIPAALPGAEFCGVAYDLPCVYGPPTLAPATEPALE